MMEPFEFYFYCKVKYKNDSGFEVNRPGILKEFENDYFIHVYDSISIKIPKDKVERIDAR